MDEKRASINEGYPSKLDSISPQPRRTLFKDKLTQRSQLNNYLLASMLMGSRVAVALTTGFFMFLYTTQNELRVLG